MREKLSSQASRWLATRPSKFTAYIGAEIEKWGKVGEGGEAGWELTQPQQPAHSSARPPRPAYIQTELRRVRVRRSASGPILTFASRFRGRVCEC